MYLEFKYKCFPTEIENKLTEGIVDLSLMEGLGHQYYDPHYFTRTESGTKPV